MEVKDLNSIITILSDNTGAAIELLDEISEIGQNIDKMGEIITLLELNSIIV